MENREARRKSWSQKANDNNNNKKKAIFLLRENVVDAPPRHL